MHRTRAGMNNLSQRRGAKPTQRRSAGPNHQMIRLVIGGVVVYVLSTLILHPAVDSKEQKMLMHRGSSLPHQPGEKHSPLMLLREREASRREQQEKERKVMEDVRGDATTNDGKPASSADMHNSAPIDASEKQSVSEGNSTNDNNNNKESSDAVSKDAKIHPEPLHHMSANEIIELQRKSEQAKQEERLKRMQEANEANRQEQERLNQLQREQVMEQQRRQQQEQEQQQQQANQQMEQTQIIQQQEQQSLPDELKNRKGEEGKPPENQGTDGLNVNQHETKIGGEDSAAKELNATVNQKRKKNKNRRKLPRMNHEHDRDAPIDGDPLQALNWPFEFQKIDMKPSVEYLGTLIDGGRHYFPVEWLKRVVDRLADMNYNLIHLRLTDDQTFNLLLKSRPQLAYPQAFDNPGRKVWTPQEMRELTAYAKSKGVYIMPEVNVPGHAGSWYGIPDLVVHCPRFICERGYGLPLNVSHHQIKPILTDIIKEVVSIFDDPPFLHLGGDEVNMADPCFHEVGKQRFNYPDFEIVLKDIIKDSGYPEDRIVRWEMTGQDSLERAGAIEHFWESQPGERHEARGRFFVSTWMYLDTNFQQDAHDVYEKASYSFKRGGGSQLPTAIIVGTFELSVQFWYERNVLGRLLAVAIGANNPQLPQDESERRKAVLNLWRSNCNRLGLGEIICETDGRPVIETRFYHEKWREGWDIWKRDICDRLTERIDYRAFSPKEHERRVAIHQANKYFWSHFPLEVAQMELEAFPATLLPDELKGLLRHTIPHTGVIIDAVSSMPKLSRLHTIIRNYLARMGFNLVQLGLVSSAGFSFNPTEFPSLGHSLLSDIDNPLYEPAELGSLVEVAATSGVAIMPEITVSTNAAGWFNAGFTVQCPLDFCKGQSLSNNINDQQLLPMIFSVIGELRTIFSSSKLFHLGTDERSASMDCWNEAQETPDFERFESKLETLLALANIAPEETLRRENREGFRYPTRAGAVTQYGIGQLDEIRSDELFFLTIDLFDGDAYSIFQNSKKAVAAQPLGILADLPKLSESKFTNWSIPKRLLAFAMGVSEIASFWSLHDEVSFARYFTQICEDLKLDDDCSPPGEATFEVELVTETHEFVEKQCNTYVTDFENVLVAKKPVAPWFETEIAVQ